MELKFVELSRLKESVKLRTGEDKSLGELAASIRSRGILCPLIVSERASDRGGESYSVLDGSRRLEALRLNGAEAGEKVPVIVVKGEDGADIERALVANAVRSGLDAWDLAEISHVLAEAHGRPAHELASALGKTERYINLLLSLFYLPRSIIAALRARQITPAHGLCLLRLSDKPKLQKEAFKRVLEQDLSVRDLEVLIGSMIEEEGGDGRGAPIFKPVVCDTKAGSRLRLEPRRRSIRIEINLKAVDDLDATIEELRKRLKALQREAAKRAS